MRYLDIPRQCPSHTHPATDVGDGRAVVRTVVRMVVGLTVTLAVVVRPPEPTTAHLPLTHPN